MAKKLSPSKDDIVYGPDGRRYKYICPSGDLHVVQPGWGDDYGDEYFDGVTEVGKVYETPPVGSYDAEIRERREALARLEEEIGVKYERVREIEEMTRKFKHYPALKNLYEFLQGKATHLVVEKNPYNGPPELKMGPIKEMLKHEGNSFWHELRLIALYGDTKGKVEWKINTYYDGSGANFTCHMCLSEEEAMSLVRKMHDQHYKLAVENLSGPKPEPYHFHNVLVNGKAFGLPVPDELVAALAEIQTRSIARDIEDLKRRLSDKQQELERASSALVTA